jgi:hypothetical protein
MMPPFNQKKPFVGLGGMSNTIAVTRDERTIICRMSSWVYWVVLPATAFFGPGLCMLLWLRPKGIADLSRMPLFLAALIMTIPVICSLLFVYYLFNHPRIEVNRESGDILFYKRGGGRPAFRLEGRDIERYEISETWYSPGEGRKRVKNHVLTVVAKGGERIALCLSTRADLIRALASEFVPHGRAND